MDDLQEQLIAYTSANGYPFHMPGHKRRLAPADGLAYAWDVTEVPGTDDLHAASGILREAMDRAAALYGSGQTWFLVNGSTCGILAGIRALCPTGSSIIAARNCHKAVFHAIELQHLQPHWVYPEIDKEFEIAGSIAPEQIEEQLELYPDARAVVLTSPTYDGVVSDIRSIANICHSRGAALFVDEAHGAHRGLPGRFLCVQPDQEQQRDSRGVSDLFGESALQLGADLVVQSAHKTLPSLTQTALLHLGAGSKLVTPREIEQQLDIFETSSPSYLLMVSLDSCTSLLRSDGRELFRTWADNLTWFEHRTQDLKHIRIYGCGAEKYRSHPAVFDFDRTKILIRVNPEDGRRLTSGAKLASLLEDSYGIVTEMHSGRNVLALSGCGDTREGFERLASALLDIDSGFSQGRYFPKPGDTARDGMITNEIYEATVTSEATGISEPSRTSEATGTPETAVTSEAAKTSESIAVVDVHTDEKHCGFCVSDGIAGALPSGSVQADIEAILRMPCQMLPEALCEGRICAEYVCPYPPGIPVLIPGEIITSETLRTLHRLHASKVRILHSRGVGDC